MGLGIRSMVPVYKIRRGPGAAEKAAEHSLFVMIVTASGRSLLFVYVAGRGLKRGEADQSIEQVKIVKIVCGGKFSLH
jgi:hypothetical protein